MVAVPASVTIQPRRRQKMTARTARTNAKVCFCQEIIDPNL
jgi:hypothetical protein